MEKQLVAVPPGLTFYFHQREANQSWEEVGKSLRRTEAKRVPAGVVNVFKSQCLAISGA